MPFWKPPKVEDIAREIARGRGLDPDADADADATMILKNWQLHVGEAQALIALFAQELTGKELPMPRRIMQLAERPRAIALEFASVAQADLFARVIQAMRLRVDVGDAGGG